MKKESVLLFLKDWMLVIGILLGICSYLLYMNIPALHPYGHFAEQSVHFIQPVLLFLMLFISFCRIDPKQIKIRTWHLADLALQAGIFIVLCVIVLWSKNSNTIFGKWLFSNRLVIEAAMVCIICPTATSCAVVTGRLGGDMSQVVTYTILINLTAAVLVPISVPLLYPANDTSFLLAFSKIIAKVFPLLILPCITAWTIKYLLPSVHNWIALRTHISFYLWSIALTLAIMMSTRAIVHSRCGIMTLVEMAAVSLACCLFQFRTGSMIGNRYSSRVEASQALGQKNTVFGIWMGYTFWNPLVSVSAGLYTIWHNVRNTLQMYRHAHKGSV